MNRLLPACTIAAVLCITSGARGAILFERSLVVDRSVNIFTTSQFDVELVFGDSFLAPSNPVKLFDGLAITPADVGQMYEANAASDPAFSQVAGRLTDGLDHFIRLVMAETASGRAEQRGWRESGFFLGHGSTEDPDLAGARIDAVQLQVDSFRLAAGGSSSNSVSAPPVELLMTFTVIGVPEPSSLALSAAGLAIVLRSVYTVAGRRRRSA